MASPRRSINSSPASPAIRRAAQRAGRIPRTLLREILDRKIEVRSGSSVRKISVREAILTRFAESALKGDTKSAAFLLQRYDMAETAQEDANNCHDAGGARNHRRLRARPISREEVSRNDASRASVPRRDPAAGTSKLFLRRCLMTLNPGSPYLPNWHIAAIAHQLERIRRGEITRLIINMPPRHLKSLTVSVAFPAFLLGHEPWRRIFAISYGSELSSKHASDFRSIVESAWYQRAFPRMQNCSKS